MTDDRTGRRAVLLTAFDRPHYLETVLRSWAAVPELPSWHLRVVLDPSDATDRMRALVEAFVGDAGLPDAEVVVNAERLGVAENPYRHLGELFDAGYDFVVRAEDDLVVADDVLRLFDHASGAYADDREVASVHAYSFEREPDGDPAALQRRPDFCPWVWGTWRDRWTDRIRPTWDRDYSTWNDSPGYESGWDWNLNTRVYPAYGLVSVSPVLSRVDNIGVVGGHGTAENHETAPTFRPEFGRITYREVG